MRVLLFAILVAGCRTEPLPAAKDGGVDFATAAPHDLAVESPPDLTMRLPDLAQAPTTGPFGTPCTQGAECVSGVCLPSGVCSRTCAGPADCPAAPEWSCPLDGGTPVCQCTPGGVPEACGSGQDSNCDGRIDDPAPQTSRQFVANTLTLPLDRTQFGMDLNGDGKVDNQLGNINGALAAQSFDVQGQADTAVMLGFDLILVSGGSSSASFDNDSCANAILQMAQNHPSPDFSGAGSFTADNSFAPGHFQGAIATSLFSSAPPPSIALAPVQLTLKLPLFGGVQPVTLVGTHVQFRYSASGLMSGQINGAIRQSDVQHQVIPALAAQLNTVVQATPCSASCQQVDAIFDSGGCVNADGTQAQAMDQKIDVCEVAQNGIIQNVLAPDVQMFDDNGNYKPNPANTKKDSLSVGFGFTAVAAHF